MITFSPGTTILSGDVNTDLAGLSDGTLDTANNSLQTTRTESLPSFVYAGLVWSTVSGLNGTMTAGTTYVQGVRVAPSSIGSHAFTASKDTYVDINTAGGFTYAEVANGAASPALTANSIRIAKVVTSGAAITSITQTGQDSLGNNLYWTSPYLPASGTAVVATSQGTATGYATDLGTVGPTVSIMVGPSGMVEVGVSSFMSQNTNTAKAFLGVDISGANTVAADTDRCISYQALTGMTGENRSGVFTFSGLAVGLTTFKLKYGPSGGGTATYSSRRISVKTW